MGLFMNGSNYKEEVVKIIPCTVHLPIIINNILNPQLLCQLTQLWRLKSSRDPLESAPAFTNFVFPFLWKVCQLTALDQ